MFDLIRLSIVRNVYKTRNILNNICNIVAKGRNVSDDRTKLGLSTESFWFGQ